MKYQEEELKALQKTEIGMLKVFVEICEKYHLRYFLLGGSCLGAVRHKGFIPWDDDIDVGMPRADYIRFFEVAPAELPSHLFLQNIQSEPDYPANFGKLRNSETAFIAASETHIKMNHGIFLDIFPLDGYRKDFLFDLKNKLYQKIASGAYAVPKELRTGKRALLEGVLKLLGLDAKKYRDKREVLLQTYPYDDCEIIANYCGAWGAKETMPKEIFGKGSKGEFEGFSVMLPEYPDQYLTRLYGDYMQLPPEEKRYSHHHCLVIDTEKSYCEYLKNL